MTPTRVPPNEEGLPTSSGEPPKGPLGKPSQDQYRSNFIFVEDRTNVVRLERDDERTDIRVAAPSIYAEQAQKDQAKHALSGSGLTIEAEREPVGDLGTLGVDGSPR
jgi:hypothetical protein